MDTQGNVRASLVLADGYSYTELIPAPDVPGSPAGSGFIRIFHAFFSPSEEDSKADAQPYSSPVVTPEQS
ncbi:hypothetical protein NAU58_18230 [Pseudomonas stutzeri]|uniref:Uncharacterized protein n=1 Tax=Stutzerimonas stutzeri TaxID=316 RepID=A0A2N8RZ90_STUST|nr:hypothetical protein [Stutzerimonas stutzeri]MCQ4297520.1 hypothetical protein [Stutzerimonas stutzeri]PNF79656.1 hypothetical protein CXK92_13490 [Stutzerimonas stutzeri]